MSKLKTIVKSAAAAGLLATAPLIQSCAPMTYSPDSLVQEEINPAAPYDKTIGNRTYTFHNFIGQEPDIIASTAENDIARYNDMSVLYLQEKFDIFNQSIAGSPNLQRYFARFNIDFSKLPEKRHHHNHKITESEKTDYRINQMSAALAPVFADMVKYSKNAEHREALILIMRTMANEARKEGTAHNADLTVYRQERTAISKQWLQNDFLKTVNLDKDLDQNKCNSIAGKLYTLHFEIVKNMQQKDKILGDINYHYLQDLTNLFFLGVGLDAAHDYTVTYVNHTNCTAEFTVIQAMERTHAEITTQELTNTAEMSL